MNVVSVAWVIYLVSHHLNIVNIVTSSFLQYALITLIFAFPLLLLRLLAKQNLLLRRHLVIAKAVTAVSHEGQAVDMDIIEYNKVSIKSDDGQTAIIDSSTFIYAASEKNYLKIKLH